MNHAEFSKQCERLKSQWAGAYSTERLALLWRDVERLPVEALSQMIDSVLAESRQAPMITDFRILIAAWNQRNRSKDQAWDGRPRSNCDQCFGLGVFLCSGPPEGADFAFRCHCPAGYSDPRKRIPQYKQAHADAGYVFKDIRSKHFRFDPQPMPSAEDWTDL